MSQREAWQKSTHTWLCHTVRPRQHRYLPASTNNSDFARHLCTCSQPWSRTSTYNTRHETSPVHGSMFLHVSKKACPNVPMRGEKKKKSQNTRDASRKKVLSLHRLLSARTGCYSTPPTMYHCSRALSLASSSYHLYIIVHLCSSQ